MGTYGTSPVKCADTSCGNVLLPVRLMDILSFTAVHETFNPRRNEGSINLPNIKCLREVLNHQHPNLLSWSFPTICGPLLLKVIKQDLYI